MGIANPETIICRKRESYMNSDSTLRIHSMEILLSTQQASLRRARKSRRMLTLETQMSHSPKGNMQ